MFAQKSVKYVKNKPKQVIVVAGSFKLLHHARVCCCLAQLAVNSMICISFCISLYPLFSLPLSFPPSFPL